MKGSSTDSKYFQTGNLTPLNFFLTLFSLIFFPCTFCLSSPLLSLFLQGPHIASVTLAAYECGSVDFPEPPYPDQIVCPQQEVTTTSSDAEQVGVEAAGVAGVTGSAALQGSISVWSIISKVRLEACMWVSHCSR